MNTCERMETSEKRVRHIPFILFVLFILSGTTLAVYFLIRDAKSTSQAHTFRNLTLPNETTLEHDARMERYRAYAYAVRGSKSRLRRNRLSQDSLVGVNSTVESVQLHDICPAPQFFRLCDRVSDRFHWKCYKEDILPIPVCYFANPNFVKFIEFTNMRGMEEQFKPFHGFENLKSITISHWQNDLSLSKIIEALPRISTINLKATHISGYQLVHSESLLEELMGLEIDKTYPAMKVMRLSKLKVLGLKITRNLPQPNLLTDLSLETLLLDIQINEAMSWNSFGMTAADLRNLKVQFILANPFSDFLPYYNLEKLSMKRITDAGLSGDTVLQVADFSHMRGFQKLKVLELDKVGFNFKNWGVFLPNLIDFYVSEFPEDVRFPTFGIMPQNLTTLYLLKTTIARGTFGTFKYPMPGLTNLTLKSCKMRLFDLEVLKQFPNLIYLNLQGNLLSSFSPKQVVAPHLRTIDLSDNLLLFFPNTLLTIPSLQVLKLRNNEIVTLIATASIQKNILATNLTTIDLEVNPLGCSCPMYIFTLFMPETTKIEGTCRYPNATSTRLNKMTGSECPIYEFSRRLARDAPLYRLQNTEAEKSLFDLGDPRLNLTADRARLLALSKNMREEDSANVMRPSFGVGFEKFKYLYPGVESYYIHFYVKWPELRLPPLDPIGFETMDLICNDTDTLVKAICDDYYPLLRFAQEQIKELRFKVLVQFDTLLNSFVVPEAIKKQAQAHSESKTDNAPTGTKREKRSAEDVFEFLTTTMSTLSSATTADVHALLNSSDWERQSSTMFWLSVFIPPAGAAMTAHHMKRRTEAIRMALIKVAGRQDLLYDSHQELRKDLTKAFTVVNDMFTNSSRNIQSLFELLNETNIEMHTIVKTVQTSFNVFQQKVKAVRILSAITARYLNLWNSNVEQYKRLLKEIDDLINAVHELQHGKLSPYLISPTNMVDAIQKSTEALNDWKKDYVLLFPSIAHYYSYSDLMFFPGPKGVIIQLNWPIQPRNSPRYDLYHTKSLYVPVQTSPSFIKRSSNHDFTKVKLPYSFLAVSKNVHFIELDPEDLTKCTMIGDSYYCSQYYLQLDQTQLTCLTSLFLNASAEVVLQHCDAEYFFEPFLPKAEIISLGKTVLISGLKQPWRYQCLQDHVPRDLPGSPFGIIETSQLCQCSIASSNGYIARRLTECATDKQPELRLEYVPNALIYASFPNLTEKAFELDSILLATEPPMEMPELQTLEKIRRFRLLNNTGGSIKLQTLVEEIDQKGIELEQRWNELTKGLSIGNWFTQDHWVKGAVVVSSFLGGIAFIISFYLCCTQSYSNGLLKSMMFVSMPTASRAIEITSEDLKNLTVDLSGRSLFHISISHLGIVILVFGTVFFGKRLIRYCCRQANLLIVHPELRRHPKVEIYLELHCGEERALLYLMTIRAPIQKLHFNGNIGPQQLTLDNHRLYSVLRPNWKEAGCQLRVGNLLLDLPCLLLVPLYRRKRVQRIMEKEFECAVIATDSVYLYRLEADHSYMLEQQQPYAKLIEDLRERQKYYSNASSYDVESVNAAETDKNPTAPSLSNIRHM